MPEIGPECPDLTIVGAGIIGLAIAWRAASRGLAVTVLERDGIGSGASRAAAGMLAPVAELEFGQLGRQMLELGLASAALWPGFATELQEAAGMPVGLRAGGTLSVARDQDEARELERQLALRESLGLQTVRLRPSQAREREPALAPTVRLAMESPQDSSVDPRLVTAALRRACELAGVRLREQARVTSVELDEQRTRVVAVRVVDERGEAGGQGGAGEEDEGQGGELVPCGWLVLAPGAWGGRLAGLPAHARLPLRPVKGQIMRLRDPAGAGLLERVVRFEGGYLVPRGDGRYVLGATMEERGFDGRPTVEGVYELLRDACELVPGAAELEIEEIGVGLRPCLPDNVPAIGRGAVDGLVWATGHHRNGILLAPLTAELVLEDLAGEPRRAIALACDPARLASAAAKLGQAVGVA